MQDAGAEAVEASAVIHGPLGGIDAAHLPFDGACGPGQVGKGVLVVAVMPPGYLGAGGTNDRRLVRTGCNDDLIGVDTTSRMARPAGIRGNTRVGMEDLQQGAAVSLLPVH